MKIVLLKPPTGFDQQSRTEDLMTFSLAPYHLAGILKAEGFESRTIDSVEIGEDFLKQDSIAGKLCDADLVGLSINTFNLSSSAKMVNRIRAAYPDIRCLIGGIHPSYYPEKTLRFTGADFALTGESDHDIVDFCRTYAEKKDLSSVPNLHWIDTESQYRYSGKAASIEEMDSVPWLPYLDDLPDRVYQMAPFETSRGCPFNCYFCSICARKNWRGRSSEAVVDNLERYLKTVKGKVNTNGILFTDDCFTIDTKRAGQILDGVRERKINSRLLFTARITDLLRSDSFLETIAGIEPFGIEAGVECGYDKGLQRLGKGFTTDHVLKCLARLKERGLSRATRLSFIIGLPDETYDDIAATLAFAAFCMERYDCTISVAWWIPAPSQLWDDLEKFGITPIDDHFYQPRYERDPSLFNYYHANVSGREIDRVGRLLRLYYSMGLSLLEVHTLPINRPVKWEELTGV